MINPYDLGDLHLADTVQKIHVDHLVRRVKKDLLQRIVEAHIKALGIEVRLTTSKTRFNGQRLWFVCPICSKRVGTLYRHGLYQTVGCRNCAEVKYRKQRYKGMVENTSICL